MPLEIERKFLVEGSDWRAAASKTLDIRQAYLASTETITMRVRITDDAEATLTIKGAQRGMTRAEFEYPIPLDDARELMKLHRGHIIDKHRHIVKVDGMRWEIDEFAGDLAGLVMAEIELKSPEATFTRPAWLGREVTDDRRYYNAQLSVNGLPATPPS